MKVTSGRKKRVGRMDWLWRGNNIFYFVLGSLFFLFIASLFCNPPRLSDVGHDIHRCPSILRCPPDFSLSVGLSCSKSMWYLHPDGHCYKSKSIKDTQLGPTYFSHTDCIQHMERQHLTHPSYPGGPHKR